MLGEGKPVGWWIFKENCGMRENGPERPLENKVQSNVSECRGF